MISRAWRIATLSAGIIAPLDCQRRDPKQASGGARRHSRPRAGLFRSGGQHHLVMVGGIIPLRRATSSRYDGRLEQESAATSPHPQFRGNFQRFRGPAAKSGEAYEKKVFGISRRYPRGCPTVRVQELGTFNGPPPPENKCARFCRGKTKHHERGRLLFGAFSCGNPGRQGREKEQSKRLN
jgi:hypothetical protein